MLRQASPKRNDRCLHHHDRAWYHIRSYTTSSDFIGTFLLRHGRPVRPDTTLSEVVRWQFRWQFLDRLDVTLGQDHATKHRQQHRGGGMTDRPQTTIQTIV